MMEFRRACALNVQQRWQASACILRSMNLPHMKRKYTEEEKQHLLANLDIEGVYSFAKKTRKSI
jgi:hypothetical protein